MAPKMKRSTSSSDFGMVYQVFLSFRGPDTRLGFADVLYHALMDVGINVFRDNEEIRKGEDIGDEILAAIGQSRVFVPIFSKGYASSKWCLIELANMFESIRDASDDNKKKILPIFYDVSVEDVKLKTDLYAKALKEHMEAGKFSTNTMYRWEEALRGAGQIKGYELKNQGQGDFVKSFVREISSMFKVKHTLLTKKLVQRDDQVEALMKLLDIRSAGVRFVGIHGMGGIGKTTLAKVVFNQLCDFFDQSCFLADVRESSYRHHKGIEKLQEQLVESVGLKLREEIRHKDDGIKMIRNLMTSKKVLLVLDDIDHREQMQYLAGDASWFKSGSRIIITTRNQSVLKDDVQTFEAKSMKPEEALRLFSMHAFDKYSPPNDYRALSEEAVASTGRLPLAVEVIGSLLWQKCSRDYWVKIIDRLKKAPHRNVLEKLMISYEALKDKAKQIFLDIANFFIGHDKTYPMYMWEACGFDPEEGLEELIHMSLVKIVVEEEFKGRVKHEKLWMHDQLRDMGRDIAGRSRIWREEEALEVIQRKQANENMEMLRFFNYPAEEYLRQELPAGLSRLRYLEFKRTVLDLKGPLPSLTWLSCRNCMLEPHLVGKDFWRRLEWVAVLVLFFCGRRPLGDFLRNSSSCLSNLAVLEFYDCYMTEDWKGWSQIGAASTKLKALDISNCYFMRKTPDFSNFTSLESLNIRKNPRLIEIDPSVGKLKNLKFFKFEEPHSSLYQDLNQINFYYRDDWGSVVWSCKQDPCITELPDTILELENVRVIDISFTRIRILPTSIWKLKRLEELRAFRCFHLVEIPRTIEWCNCLRVLDLTESGFQGLSNDPELKENLGSLAELRLSRTQITELPETIWLLKNLRVIDISFTHIWKLPRSIGMLKKLEELYASSCRSLRNIPPTIEGCTSLRVLDLRHSGVYYLPPQLPISLTDLRFP